MHLSLTSPKRGTPWIPKTLFGSGRQAQSPKPPFQSPRFITPPPALRPSVLLLDLLQRLDFRGLELLHRCPEGPGAGLGLVQHEARLPHRSGQCVPRFGGQPHHHQPQLLQQPLSLVLREGALDLGTRGMRKATHERDTCGGAPRHTPGAGGGGLARPIRSSHCQTQSRLVALRRPPRGPCAPLCDIPSGCCSFTGPWTVTRSSLRMLRRVATFCRPLRPLLLLVSFPRSRSPVVGVLGLC